MRGKLKCVDTFKTHSMNTLNPNLYNINHSHIVLREVVSNYMVIGS